MKRLLPALAVLVFATSVFAQRQNPKFFRDAWNVRSYPGAPRMAQNAWESGT